MATNQTKVGLGQTSSKLNAVDQGFQDQLRLIVGGSGTDDEKLVAAESLMYRTYGTNLTSESQQKTIAAIKEAIALHGQTYVVGQTTRITTENQTAASAAVEQSADPNDPRVRLSAFVGQELQVYGMKDRSNNILARLHDTRGLLFPYTPGISVSQDTSWQSVDLQQSNYDVLSFQKSSSASISLTAKFTAQNQREGEYMLAAIHFLRTVSKTYFGEKSSDTFALDTQNQQQMIRQAGLSGLPPPTLILSGYGNLLFNNVRCVVKSHSWSFDESADMAKFLVFGGKETVWLPPLLSISIGLAIQMNTDQIRKEFNLDDFRSGNLLSSGKTKGWF